MQLEDLWGFWLVRQKITPSKIADEEARAEIVNNFEEFAKKVKERYADNSIIENPPQTLDSEIVDRIYFDMAFSQDRNILQKPHFSTIRNNDYNFLQI